MIRIKWAVSNRHIHLSKIDAEALEVSPRPEKWLGIADNYVSDTYVYGLSGLRYRVLLPFREESQLEVLASDCKAIGIEPTYRFSGRLRGAPTILVRGLDVGPWVRVKTIVAMAHIHCPPWAAGGFVQVVIDTKRPVILPYVKCFPHPECKEAILHLDRDEACAAGMDDASKAFLTSQFSTQDILSHVS